MVLREYTIIFPFFSICTPILVFIAIFQAKMKQFIPLIGRTICQLGETLYYMNGR